MSFESIGWHGCLERAATPEEVAALARDFMALWTPYEIELLPREVRPGKIVDADDVARIALKVNRAPQMSEIVPGALVHRLAIFFSQAASRLAQLREGSKSAARLPPSRG